MGKKFLSINLLLIIATCLFAMYGCGSNSGTESKVSFDKISVNKTHCQINKIFEDNGKNYITVDYVNILSGKEAEEYCKKKNIPVYDDFIVENEKVELKTFVLSDKVEIILLDPMDAKPISGKTIKELIERASVINVIIINVNDGLVTRIEQFFTP